ncbi:Zn-dependent hydrolase [Pseudenhygromyxa sp. WMMC2535]|uniref:Zn-dependent hydrolase n=1 Tax=Pseudenhygromyxa sp. WMMC2535 TaxID=2712867 RepID=UPI0015539B63|nr:Zn-dependent hydrolase [Pseudenhygromyxa sp. WMMC2535]NVB41043.1 Zn-dependent hydrolase [Pseudenhygromyxa sp. WMMC2535]
MAEPIRIQADPGGPAARGATRGRVGSGVASLPLHEARVDFPRLRADIEALSAIGRQSDRSISRRAFSPADMQARAWLRERIEDAGLEAHQDGAANLHARLGWDGSPSVMVGSHIDTVPSGGPLDGALGVLVGLECLRRLRELDYPLKHPLESVAFSDEEGRFGGLLGSQAIAGQLSPGKLHKARDLEGVSLVEAMAAHGLDAMDALQARRRPESLLAYLELHIEQGPVLERRGATIGVVEAITGLFKWEIRMLGTPNHAGTTPMDMRNDAFTGVVEFAAALPRLLDENGSPQSRATIGRVELQPGSANTVPGAAICSLDVRDPDPQILRELAEAMRRSLSAIARRHGLMFEFEVLSQIEPVACDPGLVDRIDAAAESLDYRKLRMPSGAVHDAQIMAKLTRVGMIFVPSLQGMSHSAAEWTAWEDIEAGANVALRVLAELACAIHTPAS